MISTSMFILILSCAVVTWIPRVLPFIIVRKIRLPTLVMRWLNYIPVCILSALVISSLLNTDGNIVSINWQISLAFIPTLFIAITTKSLSITVLAGIIIMAFIRFLF